MRDTIVPVLRVAAEIAVEPVAHVQEFLGNHHFERARTRAIDTWHVDQDEMFTRCGRKRVGATDRAAHASSQPAFKVPTLRCDAQAVGRQFESRDVSLHKPARFLVVDQPAHDGDLQRARGPTAASRILGVASVCGAESS
jgi:hypothetical protein